MGLDRFNPQELSLLAWSAATVAFQAETIMFAVRQRLLSLDDLQPFSSAALSNIAWAFARTMQAQPEIARPAMQRIDVELARRGLHRMLSKELSTLVWAFAKVGLSSASIFQLAIDELRSADLEAYSAQSLAMVAWSLETSYNHDDKVLTRLVEEVERRGLQGFQNRELNALLLALSKGAVDGTIWHMVDAEAQRRAGNQHET